MFQFLNLQPEIFGVDVNDSSLRMVKLRKKRRGFAVVSYSEVDVPLGVVKEGVIQDNAALVKVIKRAYALVKGKRLGTRYAIVSLPEEKSFSQVIQMPMMTDDELRGAVPFEAENYIPLPVDKVYLDFESINTHEIKDKGNAKHLDLLINVMPKSIVDSYVACFKAAGLIPCILELESQAIARALMKQGAATPPVILIDLGTANTSFIIFSGNSIRFTSSIPISSQQLTQMISEQLRLPLSKAEAIKVKFGLLKRSAQGRQLPVEKNIRPIIQPMLDELVSQIKKYMLFYRDHVSHEYFPSDGNIEKIILCGGGGNLPGLSDFLFDALRIPVEIGNPFVNISPYDNGKAKLIPVEKILSFTTALGLALRGASEKS